MKRLIIVAIGLCFSIYAFGYLMSIFLNNNIPLSVFTGEPEVREIASYPKKIEKTLKTTDETTGETEERVLKRKAPFKEKIIKTE